MAIASSVTKDARVHLMKLTCIVGHHKTANVVRCEPLYGIVDSGIFIYGVINSAVSTDQPGIFRSEGLLNRCEGSR